MRNEPRFRTVCSAHAEVIPRPSWASVTRTGLLRTRGGDPNPPARFWNASESAPHTRR